jgi:hypothetical protein
MLIFMHVNKSAGDRGIQHVLCICCSTTGLQRVDVPIDYMSIKIKIRTCLNLIMPHIMNHYMTCFPNGHISRQLILESHQRALRENYTPNRT